MGRINGAHVPVVWVDPVLIVVQLLWCSADFYSSMPWRQVGARSAGINRLRPVNIDDVSQSPNLFLWPFR